MGWCCRLQRSWLEGRERRGVLSRLGSFVAIVRGASYGSLHCPGRGCCAVM